jgi:hypothetical protein
VNTACLRTMKHLRQRTGQDVIGAACHRMRRRGPVRVAGSSSVRHGSLLIPLRAGRSGVKPGRGTSDCRCRSAGLWHRRACEPRRAVASMRRGSLRPSPSGRLVAPLQPRGQDGEPAGRAVVLRPAVATTTVDCQGKRRLASLSVRYVPRDHSWGYRQH